MFDQILVLFGQPPGSLVYHFIILFAVQAALAISLGQWLRDRRSATARLTVATLIIVVARFAVLVAALLAWQGYVPRNIVLPPIERAADTITVIGLAWLFITMKKADLLERDLFPDAGAAAAVSMSVAGFVGTYYYWLFAASGGQLFNGQIFDIVWSGAQVLVAVVGLVWMLTRVRYIYDPFLKGFILIVLGTAAALHIVQPSIGDVAAAVRLGQLIAMPMLAAMAYRHVVEQLLRWDDFVPVPRRWEQETTARSPLPPVPALPESIAPPEPRAVEPDELTEENIDTPVEPFIPAAKSVDEAPAPPEPSEQQVRLRRQTSPEPPPPSAAPLSEENLAVLEIVESLESLLATLEEQEIIREAPRAVATALKADIALIGVVDQRVGAIGLVGGYDNIAQSFLPQVTLDLAKHPSIVTAMGRLKQTRLRPERHEDELIDMYDSLGITHIGPAYLQPLTSGDERLAVLIVGFPYSGREMQDPSRNLLDRMAPLVSRALLNAERFQDLREELDRVIVEEGQRMVSLSDDLTAAQAELNAANRQMEEMKAYIRDMHRQMQSEAGEQRDAREQVDALLDEVERLRPQAIEANALRERYDALRAQHEELSERVAELRETAAAAEQLRADNAQLREKAQQRGLEVAALKEQRDRYAEEAAHVAELQREIGALTERFNILKEHYEEAAARSPQPQNGAQAEIERLEEEAARTRDLQRENDRLRRELEALQAASSALPAGSAENLLAERQLEELRKASQMEIASLRTRLAEAAISQQEVTMLQEQLGVRAREVIDLKTKLAETQALANALREQAEGRGSSDMGAVQAVLQRQRAEIERLRQELLVAREEAALNASGVQAEINAVEQQTLAQLEAQLDERGDMIERLQAQLEERSQAATDLRLRLNEIAPVLERLEAQLQTRTEEVNRLQAELQEARSQARARIDELQAQLDGGQGDADTLHEAEIETLEAEIEARTAQVEALEAQLAEARADIERLEAQLRTTDIAVDSAMAEATQIDSRAEVIASMVQELRTPMTSILGYTELVLGESLGILGEAQRKFLQRVQANTERMGALLDDLTNLIVIETSSVELNRERVDIIYTIEEAITQVASQYRERELTLRLALLENYPPLIADRDSLLDIIDNLLANAGLASPTGGEVYLTVGVDEANLPSGDGYDITVPCLHITVEDSGGGIAPDDIDRVFGRKYRADNPLIEGLGDTGVSLSVAKAFVEAHGGRIWIESEPGIGTSFHVLLPLEPLED